LNAIDAAKRGAQVPRSPAISARREDGAWTVTTKGAVTGETRTFRARCLVNAAGPWVSDVITCGGIELVAQRASRQGQPYHRAQVLAGR